MKYPGLRYERIAIENRNAYNIKIKFIHNKLVVGVTDINLSDCEASSRVIERLSRRMIKGYVLSKKFIDRLVSEYNIEEKGDVIEIVDAFNKMIDGDYRLDWLTIEISVKYVDDDCIVYNVFLCNHDRDWIELDNEGMRCCITCGKLVNDD